MLVLARREHESIQIGDDIVIEVLSCSAGGVRLGIRAPRSVKIARSEILDRPAEGSTQKAVRASEPAAAGVRSREMVLPYGGAIS